MRKDYIDFTNNILRFGKLYALVNRSFLFDLAPQQSNCSHIVLATLYLLANFIGKEVHLNVKAKNISIHLLGVIQAMQPKLNRRLSVSEIKQVTSSSRLIISCVRNRRGPPRGDIHRMVANPLLSIMGREQQHLKYRTIIP